MIRDLAAGSQNTEIAPALMAAGQAANAAAAAGVFSDYQARKSKNTLGRQRGDLALFADFLRSVGVSADPGALGSDPAAWAGITWGLVAAFQRWQLTRGYAVESVNVRVSTVKVYAKLAFKAGTLPAAEYAMIGAVESYAHKEVKRIDDLRAEMDHPTRKGAKKSQAVSLSPGQAAALKDQPDTPQGRRDALIMCLLLDHGLRVGELAGLLVSDLDLSTRRGELRFYRQKVDKTQTHRLTEDTQRAALAYLAQDAPAVGSLWRGSRKGGAGLTTQGLTARAITKRVRHLGTLVGAVGLSAHDCRHYWATQAARAGTALDRLQDAGGWSSLAMPGRYIEAARIANEGVRL